LEVDGQGAEIGVIARLAHRDGMAKVVGEGVFEDDGRRGRVWVSSMVDRDRDAGGNGVSQDGEGGGQAGSEEGEESAEGVAFRRWDGGTAAGEEHEETVDEVRQGAVGEGTEVGGDAGKEPGDGGAGEGGDGPGEGVDLLDEIRQGATMGAGEAAEMNHSRLIDEHPGPVEGWGDVVVGEGGDQIQIAERLLDVRLVEEPPGLDAADGNLGGEERGFGGVRAGVGAVEDGDVIERVPAGSVGFEDLSGEG
jgi:hypothetical protein